MHLKKIIFVFFVSLLFHLGHVYGQTNTTVSDSIDHQFESIIKSSNTFKSYKVIRRSKMADLRSSTKQQVLGLEKQIGALHQKIDQQQQQVSQFKTELDKTNASLEQVRKSKDEVSLFGIPLTKGTFKVVVFGIIIVLIVLLVGIIYKYKDSHKVTAEARKNLEEIEEEYGQYKQKALETQQRLGRQLQDERNKNAQNG